MPAGSESVLGAGAALSEVLREANATSKWRGSGFILWRPGGSHMHQTKSEG